MNIYSIYRITNLINNKLYIGFTSKTIVKRFNNHNNTAISNAINLYGKENFTIEHLYQSYEDEHTLNVMEPFFIAEYNTFLGEGYNQTPGGDRTRGMLGKSIQKKLNIK